MAIGSSSQRPHRSEPRVQLACPRVARLTVCSRRVKTSLDTSVSYCKQHGPCAYSVHPKHTHRDLSIATPSESGESRLPPVPPKMALPRGVQDAGDAAPQPLSRPRATDETSSFGASVSPQRAVFAQLERGRDASRSAHSGLARGCRKNETRQKTATQKRQELSLIHI